MSYFNRNNIDMEARIFMFVLDLKEDEVFIDVGGFDGATSIEFIKHCPHYKSIYIFEPVENNLDKAKKNLKDYKNINKLKNVVLHFNKISLPLLDIVLSGENQIKLDENTMIEIQNYNNVIGLLLMDINDTGDICGYSDKYKFNYKVHKCYYDTDYS